MRQESVGNLPTVWHMFPRNPFYAANELGCHPAMRFIVVVDQSCGENNKILNKGSGDGNIWGWVKTYKNTIFNGMNIHKSQLFCGSLGTRVMTHSHMRQNSGTLSN